MRKAACLLMMLALSSATIEAATPQSKNQQTYPTPNDAVDAMKGAVSSNSRDAFERIAPGALDQLASGDSVQDNLSLLTFSRRLLSRAVLIQTDESTTLLYVGLERVLLPIPLKKASSGWYFDVNAGRKQIIDKRIGNNERRALEIFRLMAKAQTKYMAVDRDGDGVLEYAQRIGSTPGKQDGLYWPKGELAAESPLGPLMSLAKSQGYSKGESSGPPYQGYVFRILTRQGANAAGGAKDYVVDGNMTGGFAAIAYPAKWGSSGVMTMLLGPDGKVFEKNLGTTTQQDATAITAFDPDASWAEVQR